MPRLRTRFNKRDAAGFCAALTAKGRSEVLKFTEDTPSLRGPKSCDAAVVKAMKALGSEYRQFPVKIKTVSIRGNDAKVTIQGGQAGIDDFVTYTLVQEDAGWKLDDPVSAGKTRVSRTTALSKPKK